jgi:hypothetical protein
LGVVHERQPMALSLGVEHAEGKRTHERALLLAPVAVADCLHERTDLGGNPGPAGAASLHELAHACLADAHALGCLRSRETLQIAERGGLALTCVQAPAQPLEQLAQPHAIVELLGKIALGGTHDVDVGLDKPWPRTVAGGPRRTSVNTSACAQLLDGSPEGHEHKPAAWVGDLLPLEHRRVKALPGDGVTRLEIARIEVGSARPKLPTNARQHPVPQPLELVSQQTFSAKATKAEGAHSPAD